MRILIPYPNYAACAYLMTVEHVQHSLLSARRVQAAIQESDPHFERPELVLQWQPHLLSLMMYGDCMVREYYRATGMTDWPLMLNRHPDDPVKIPSDLEVPPWVGDEKFHVSHQQTMLTEDPDHYGQFWGPDATENNNPERCWSFWGERREK